jgi:hypothetical protein
MSEKEAREPISRRDLFRFAGLLAAATLAARCSPPSPEATPTPSGPSPTPKPTEKPSPTPTKPVEPEPTPQPTVVVETEGFGGLDELTDAERVTVTALQEAYEQAAHEQDLAGTVVLTRGDEEGEIGAFFRDSQTNPWSLVTREEVQVLEQVPLYNGIQAKWVPNEMRFEYSVDGETFFYETENSLLINQEGVAVSQWNGETAQWEEVPSLTPTPEPTETPEDTVYITAQEITGYTSPGGEEIGHIIPGQSFVILEEQDGWLRIRLAAGGEGWIQASDTAYYPEGQAPPTPEPQPYPSCEAPHFTGRTPDRKTGVVIKFGNPRQEIEPDRPYVMKYDRVDIGAPWYTRRDARITAIDSQNQIVTFQLCDGSTRQRRFTKDTLVLMMAHNVYQGMPGNEYKQLGGNLCDLEVGDVASILHPNEAESANPNSSLTNLWGVFIVQ